MKGGEQKDDEYSNDNTKHQNNSDNHMQKHLTRQDIKTDNSTANIASLIMIESLLPQSLYDCFILS